MEKMLYWPVRWPWLAALVVFVGLTQLPLGPWYVSAWLVIGATLAAMILVKAERLRLVKAMAAPNRLVRLRPGSQGAEVARLRTRLGLPAGVYFGPATKKKLTERQTQQGQPADGVFTPELDMLLGWGVFGAPADA